MPELPEVETTRRGIEPHVLGQRFRTARIRQPALRWPVPHTLPHTLGGQDCIRVGRRGKYLLLECRAGTLIIHLGMSGSLRLVAETLPPTPHDHVDLCLVNGQCLRLRDPRRFGSILWTGDPPEQHPLLANLGPEPLEDGFDGAYLHASSRGRRIPVKSLLMDAGVVAGVGNIYAQEALFRSGIHPNRAAGRISLARYTSLALAVRAVLVAAIQAGGTTLRDFNHEDGRPGYFQISLAVYGRAGQPCLDCGTQLRATRIGQRSTVYCPSCQR